MNTPWQSSVGACTCKGTSCSWTSAAVFIACVPRNTQTAHLCLYYGPNSCCSQACLLYHANFNEFCESISCSTPSSFTEKGVVEISCSLLCIKMTEKKSNTSLSVQWIAGATKQFRFSTTIIIKLNESVRKLAALPQHSQSKQKTVPFHGENTQEANIYIQIYEVIGPANEY